MERLPDVYAKGKESNNYKFLQIQQAAIEQVEQDLIDLEKMLALEGAKGAALDLYGQMLGQPRGVLNDSQYRFVLRNRMVRSRTTGTYQDVIEGIEEIFGAEHDQVEIEPGAEPGVVQVKRLPFEVLMRAGLSGKRALELIGTLMVAGVRVEAENFEGTFCFTEKDQVLDWNAGFGDEQGQRGGALGFAMGEEEEDAMPME